MDAVGEELDGTPRAGTFTATTLPFEITVREDAGDIDGAPAFDFEIGLGDGLFDPDLAALFNVLPMTSGGGIGFGLEGIEGDPMTRPARIDHRGRPTCRSMRLLELSRSQAAGADAVGAAGWHEEDQKDVVGSGFGFYFRRREWLPAAISSRSERRRSRHVGDGVDGRAEIHSRSHLASRVRPMASDPARRSCPPRRSCGRSRSSAR